ncbi:hypothetical protein TNCV_3836911 [Trichonephila clavipes]|nr:hypothetical protein TNCV_3836911 [Trichonephila clavipes]
MKRAIADRRLIESITNQFYCEPLAFLKFSIHFFKQAIIGNRSPIPSPCFILIISATTITELSNPLSHQSITHFLFIISLYKLPMNFNWLSIPCVQKTGTGSSRFPLKTPLGFFGAEKVKFFPTKSRSET